MSPWPLAALLDAHTIALCGATARISKPLRRKGRGHVDLAISATKEGRNASVKPRAELFIDEERGAHSIGVDGALWRPGLELNIKHRQQASEPDAGAPHLLFADNAGLLRALLQRGAQRGITFAAGISPGSHTSVSSWQRLLEAALCLPSRPQLCFALDRASTVEALLHSLPSALRDQLDAAPLVLLLPAPGEHLAHLEQQAQLCAAGIPAFSQPDRLFAARELQQKMRQAGTGQVLGLVADAHEAPLLDAALAETRLRPATPGKLDLPKYSSVYLAPSRQFKLGRALKRADTSAYDVIVSIGPVPQAEGVDTPHLSLDGPTSAESTLHGLRSLLDAGAGLAALPAPPPSPPGARGTTECLDEAQIFDALERLDFPCSQHALVTSASAAARIARDEAVPLRLRAVGPLFADQLRWGGERDGVEGPAAARQAFRDILFACQEHATQAPLRAVLVVPRPKLPEMRVFCDLRAATPLFHISPEGAAHGVWARADANTTALTEYLLAVLPSRKEVKTALFLLATLRRLAPALERDFGLLDLELVQLTPQGPRLLHGRGSKSADRAQ